MATARKTTTKAAPKKAAPAAAKTANPAGDATAMIGEFTAAAQEQFQTAFEAFSGNAEEMQAHFEKAQTQLSETNAELMQAAQTEVSEAVQFANDLTQAKTFADALEVQQAYWTNLFESRVERTRDLTEKTVEATKEVMAPATSFGDFFDPNAYTKFFPFATKA